ncbi:MAG: hypothetical protein Q8L98_01645 [Chlamydiales bacterium]|nr:hypothetical protein [Chlamydiales bacterium]
MNVKKLISLGVIAVGILMIGYGVHSKYSISQMKNEIHQISQSKNKTVKSAGKDLEMKILHKNAGTKWFFFGGGILIVLGSLAFYHWYHKKKR